MTWQLGILSDRAGHVHLGAIVATSDDHGCEFVELLAPVGACRPDELDVARVTVIRGEQLAELGRLAERCIDDAPLRDRLVELTRRSLMRTGDSRLASLEQATRLLQHARTVDEVRSIINKAEAARVYAQQARLGLEAQNYAAEVKLRAERRAGELLAEMELRDGGHAMRARSQPATELAAPPRLSDLGITRSQSSRWQAIARVPQDIFEQTISHTRAGGEEVTTAAMVKLAPRPPRRSSVDLLAPASAGPRDRFTAVDVIELARLWPTGSVDLWVTSPPYALGQPYLGGDAPDYESWLEAVRAWLAAMYALSNPDHGRLCLNVPLDRDLDGWRPVSADVIRLATAEAGWRFRTWIVWDKNQAGAGTERGTVDSASAPNVTAPVESILVFYRGAWSRPGPAAIEHADWLNLCGPRGLWRFPGVPGNEFARRRFRRNCLADVSACFPSRRTWSLTRSAGWAQHWRSRRGWDVWRGGTIATRAASRPLRRGFGASGPPGAA